MLTPEEVRALIDEAEQGKRPEMARAILVAATTGLHRAELCALRRVRVLDFERREDDDGLIWALLRNAKDASAVVSGAMLRAGIDRAWSWVQVSSRLIPTARFVSGRSRARQRGNSASPRTSPEDTSCG